MHIYLPIHASLKDSWKSCQFWIYIHDECERNSEKVNLSFPTCILSSFILPLNNMLPPYNLLAQASCVPPTSTSGIKFAKYTYTNHGLYIPYILVGDSTKLYVSRGAVVPLK